jgi:hypothetical protein
MDTSVDLAGHARIHNSRVDIGAYEYGIKVGISYSAVDITWYGAPGRTYQVQWATSLSQPTWQDLGPPTNSIGGAMYYMDVIRGLPRRVYRVVETD